MFGSREALDRYRQLKWDLLFDWQVPEPGLVIEGNDGSIAIDPASARQDALRHYAIGSYDAEWVNFTQAAMTSTPKEMIEGVGFLRLGYRDEVADWADMQHVLGTALRPWGDVIEQKNGVRALVFGSNEAAIADAQSALHAKLQEAIADGGITVMAQHDIAVRARPTDLRSFMLLDAAEAIQSQAEYHKCANCQSMFRPQDKRPRAYCSLYCRGALNRRNYLARKKQRTA